MTEQINHQLTTRPPFLYHWISYVFIFAPIIIVVTLYNIPLYNEIPFGIREAILFFVFDFTLAILYFLQIYNGFKFFKVIDQKSYIFFVNGMIPMIFWVIACVWYLYSLPIYIKMSPVRQDLSPDNPLTNKIIYVFILHYIISYFILNNLIIRVAFKKINDLDLKQTVKIKYYIPMLRMVRSTAIIILMIFIYTFIYYILTH